MERYTAHLILLTGLLFACDRPETLEKEILGKWTMEKVLEYGEDVTEKHNPAMDRWIEFKADGTFVSDGSPFGRNAGRWTAGNEESILYLDSDVDDDDSEWKVTFRADTTYWTGIGHPRKENTTLIHRRSQE